MIAGEDDGRQLRPRLREMAQMWIALRLSKRSSRTFQDQSQRGRWITQRKDLREQRLRFERVVERDPYRRPSGKVEDPWGSCYSDRSADSDAFCASGPSCFHPCGRWRIASSCCFDSCLVPEICQAHGGLESLQFDWDTRRARYLSARPGPHRWGQWHWSDQGVVGCLWKVRRQTCRRGTWARCAESWNVPLVKMLEEHRPISNNR